MKSLSSDERCGKKKDVVPFLWRQKQRGKASDVLITFAA